MSKVYFIGDLHFGHKGILAFRPGFRSVDEHDEFICAVWNSKVTKRDLVYIMGDVAFTIEGLERVGTLLGRKILVRGNHDIFPIHRYLTFFEDVLGFAGYKDDTGKYWLSHAPIHNQELRSRINIHGHMHNGQIYWPNQDKGKLLQPDHHFWNVSAEKVDYEPKTTKEIISLRKQGIHVSSALEGIEEFTVVSSASQTGDIPQ